MADSCSQQSVYMDCGLPFQLLARETESEPKIIQDPPSVSVGMMCANANAHKRYHSFLSSFVVLLVPSTAHPVGKSQTVKYEPPLLVHRDVVPIPTLPMCTEWSNV